MKTLYIISAFIIGILLVNCGGADYARELGQIDSLKKELNRTDSLITAINRADIAKRADEITNNSKFIQFNVNRMQDTLDYSTALMLTQYKNIGDVYKKMDGEFNRLHSAIDSVNVGLENLRHDLLNHSLAKGVDPGASVLHESTEVFQIQSYAGDLAKNLEDTRKSYDTLLPKVNSFVNRLNAQPGSFQPAP